jgi:hypothetical protein
MDNYVSRYKEYGRGAGELSGTGWADQRDNKGFKQKRRKSPKDQSPVKRAP